MLEMFERLTEQAGLVVSSARDAASLWGGTMLEPEHLLLGLLQQDPALIESLLLRGDSVRAIQKEVEEQVDWGETKLLRSADMPTSESARRVFSFAAAEADRLWHNEIGPGHLLLGLLHVSEGPTISTLRRHGLRLPTARKTVEQLAEASPVAPEVARRRRMAFLRLLPVVPDEETARRLAEAVWRPIVGREILENNRPFEAQLAGCNFAANADFSAAQSQGWLELPRSGSAWFVLGAVRDEDEARRLVAVIDPGTGRILYLSPHP